MKPHFVRPRLLPLILGAAALLNLSPAHAQGSRADYERSAQVRRTTLNTVFRDRIEPNWLPGNTRFWYEVATGPGTREYVLVDAERGERKAAFDHPRLAAALRAAGIDDAQPNRLRLTALAWPVADELSFNSAGRSWRIRLSDYSVLEQQPAPGSSALVKAPEEGPTRSRSGGEQTPLRIVNRSTSTLELFWLDLEGTRRSYGDLAPGETNDQLTYAGHAWLVVEKETRQPWASFEATAAVVEVVITERVRTARPAAGPTRRGASRNRSPDGAWTASIRDHNVVLRNESTAEEVALSTDGHAGNAYQAQFAWSPDGKKLVTVQVEPGEEHKVSVVESSPANRVQPVLHTFNYYKPGDKLPHPRPVLWEVAARRKIPVDDALFPRPYTTTGGLDVRWTADGTRFVFRYNQRGHQVLRLIAVDGATGAVQAVVDEQAKTFIAYSSKSYQHWLDDSHEVIWMSERDGWNHLYLYDSKTGLVKNQITRGEWVVRSVDHVDAGNRQIWIQASGIVPGQDPYHIHYCRVNFDGTGLVVLTEGDGTHGGTFSPDRRYLIDRYSRVDLPPVTTLRRTDNGCLVCTLERADHGALQRTGWNEPERFVAKGRDGATDIYGVIVRPMNFDPTRKYPIIEKIYAGPHGAHVPKAFSPLADMQELAELGFVVVQCDGMGTNFRSKKFHDVCWQNIADAGLPDRVPWIKAAAAKYPSLDATRVGIYGTSAGGQNSLGALLTHGDFYKVAVSDCGCHDNRMDKIWWNEQWMSWPIGPHYAEQSNVTMAPRLQGKLLLMLGELDRNVDPASTMQVANALIKANKDFDLVVVPGAGHGVAGSPFGKRKLQDFFVRHLHGREPRWVESGTN